MSKKITAADCQSCGACCVAVEDTPIWAEATRKELDRIATRVGKRVALRVISTRFGDLGVRTGWKKQTAGPARGLRVLKCTCLDGNVMRKVSCRIYADRPKVCSTFKPGSRGCLELRRGLQEKIEDAQASRV